MGRGSNWALVTTDHRGLLTDMGGGVTGHWSLQTILALDVVVEWSMLLIAVSWPLLG